jgi:DNA-binding FadR family transcriptional regulator
VRLSALQSDILRFIIENGYGPGDQLPTIQEISASFGVSVAKTREALEVARALGLLEIKPGRGTRVAEYDFKPAVTLSALYAIGMDAAQFTHLRRMRDALELHFWEEALGELTGEDIAALRDLIAEARRQLSQRPAHVPVEEHRAFHMLIFSRLENPFVNGFLEAFWEAYEAFGLHRYRDLSYHHKVWNYHERIVDAVEAGDVARGRHLLAEHMNLLNERTVPDESDELSLEQRGWFFE